MANGLFDYKRSLYEVKGKYKEYQDSLERDFNKINPIRATMQRQSQGLIKDSYSLSNQLGGQSQLGYAISSSNPISINTPVADSASTQGGWSEMSREQKGNKIAGAVADVANTAGTYMSVLNSESESDAQDIANTANLTLNSAVTGAKLGSMVGGPIGAGVGAVVGGVAGLITGNRKQSKEQRRRDNKLWAKQKDQFEKLSTAREREEGMSERAEELERLSKLRASQLNYFDIKY